MTLRSLVIAGICISSSAWQAAKAQSYVQPDLTAKNALHSSSRTVTRSTDASGRTVVHLGSAAGPGVAWLKDVSFSSGTIEFDVKGKDVLQESFVGIAFHGSNDSTYESVYFRPFNFQVADSIRRKHAVQYIFLPRYDWDYLRETYPDVYEHGLNRVTDPNVWFHARIEVTSSSIRAFVNDDTTPCLVVTPLNTGRQGRLGFWVGNGSDGDFRDLRIKAN